MTVSIERVDDDILRIRCRTWRGAAAGYDVSAFVIGDVLIDTGFVRVGNAFLAALATLRVRGAIITHWHEDHAGNVAALAGQGLPLVMHERCDATLRVRPSIRLYRRFVWGRAPRLLSPVMPFDPAPLTVIATPGHTTDHLVVWDAAHRLLVSGDLFLGVKVRVAHLHESPRALLASLAVGIALAPERLLDAHRGVVTDATAMLRAKARWLAAVIEEVDLLAAQGMGERAIQRRVLGAEATVGWLSRGEYSKRSLVRAVLREAGAP